MQVKRNPDRRSREPHRYFWFRLAWNLNARGENASHRTHIQKARDGQTLRFRVAVSIRKSNETSAFRLRSVISGLRAVDRQTGDTPGRVSSPTAVALLKCQECHVCGKVPGGSCRSVSCQKERFTSTVNQHFGWPQLDVFRLPRAQTWIASTKSPRRLSLLWWVRV